MTVYQPAVLPFFMQLGRNIEAVLSSCCPTEDTVILCAVFCGDTECKMVKWAEIVKPTLFVV